MKKQEGSAVFTLMYGVALLCVAMLCAGCFPLLTGMKRYKSGSTEIDFVTGGDFSVGANGVDRVDDRRGIQPGRGFEGGTDGR